MKSRRISRFLFLLIIISGTTSLLNAKSIKVPGVGVNYIPASTKIFIGSPSICILPNGDYVASNDYFGPASTEKEKGLTTVFLSVNKGKTWRKISEIHGQYWSNLFIHCNALYIMGTWKHLGNIVIRRSLDGGITWSDPTDKFTGLLRDGAYHTAPMPMLIHNGRIWRAYENVKPEGEKGDSLFYALIISAPVNADLLNASSWTTSNYLPHNPTFLNGKFRGWIEGNAVVTREGRLIDFLRVNTSGKGIDLAAVINFSVDGETASFDPSTGFMDFVGGSKKFSIRYDTKSARYWTISNLIAKEFSGMDAGLVRNTVVIQSSSDLINWTVHKVLLHHPDILKHGFQYIDWQYEGQDIIFVSNTAWDDEFTGADSFHNTNYLTFHRIKNFRKLQKESIQINK